MEMARYDYLGYTMMMMMMMTDEIGLYRADKPNIVAYMASLLHTVRIICDGHPGTKPDLSV